MGGRQKWMRHHRTVTSRQWLSVGSIVTDDDNGAGHAYDTGNVRATGPFRAGIRIDMLLSLIVAADRNWVIGRDNAMPWHLPSDLRFFKRATLNKPLLLGRRTFEAIGRPLPGRRVIVISRRPGFRAGGCETAASLEQALALARPAPEVMIGGGAELYRQTLAHADRLYLTRVDAEVEGDTRFPAIDVADWRVLWRQRQPADARHAHAYSRLLLSRR